MNYTLKAIIDDQEEIIDTDLRKAEAESVGEDMMARCLADRAIIVSEKTGMVVLTLDVGDVDWKESA